jgi:hypothetical protein
VPAGIIAALVISTVLYVVMAAVMTGMVSYEKLNVSAPVAVALDEHPSLFWLGLPVKIGAIVGMTSVILMSILGQPRIFMAMSRDGLLPPVMEKVHPKYRTPSVATLITGALAAIFAGVFPIDVLGELVSIGFCSRSPPCASGCWCCGVRCRKRRASIPRTVRADHLHGGRACLPRAHARAAERHVDPAAGMDGDRVRDLFRLRVLEQPAAGTISELTRAALPLLPGLRVGLGVVAACRRATQLEAGEVERRGIREVRRRDVAHRRKDGLGAARELQLPLGKHPLHGSTLQVVLRPAELAGDASGVEEVLEPFQASIVIGEVPVKVSNGVAQFFWDALFGFHALEYTGSLTCCQGIVTSRLIGMWEFPKASFR